MHNYAEWQKLDTKDYILHDSIYIKIYKMPANLQKRQQLLPGDNIAGKNYKEHIQGNFQEQNVHYLDWDDGFKDQCNQAMFQESSVQNKILLPY